MIESAFSEYFGKSSREAYGIALFELAAKDERIVALTSDVPESVRFSKFRDSWPERFFDFGIAEQNMMSAAAGLARSGKLPYVSVYAIFASLRAIEQARTDIAYPGLPVKIIASHSGISLGPGGPTHHSIEDIAVYRSIANMTIAVPADGVETAEIIRASHSLPGPLYVRLSREAEPPVYQSEGIFTFGKSRQVRGGGDITIIACGAPVGRALNAADQLINQGIQVRLIDMATIKPLDKAAIIDAAKQTGLILTVEEHNIIGGLGSAVAEVIAEAGIHAKMLRLGIPDEFTLAAPYQDLIAHYRLDEVGITEAVKALLARYT
ncbi:MAG: transketolase family protein [Anaerolineales bacterium]|nr:MAG: transketolase family protein [Anaerolineales bacterium]